MRTRSMTSCTCPSPRIVLATASILAMLVLYQLLLKCTKCQYGELTVSLLFSAPWNTRHAHRALVSRDLNHSTMPVLTITIFRNLLHTNIFSFFHYFMHCILLGITTGNCSGNETNQNRTCEILAWCPVENEKKGITYVYNNSVWAMLVQCTLFQGPGTKNWY